MLQRVGIFEVKTKLSSLIDEVTRTGKDLIITRRGKDVARIIAVEHSKDADSYIDAIREFRKGKYKGDIDIKEMVEEGRR